MFVDESFVGTRSEKISVKITEELVRSYLHSIDEKEFFIPPTFPFIFWQYFFSSHWLIGKGPFIHGTQNFYYEEHLQLNQTYECYIQFNKATKKRNMQFLDHDLLILKEGKEIGKASSVFIIVGKREL